MALTQFVKTNRILRTASLAALTLCAATPSLSGQQILAGHVPRAVARSQALTRLPESTRLSLAIGLPLRNQEALEVLLAEIADPASPHFHQYLTPAQFAAEFGPSQHDYEELERFARENGLVVSGTHPNRMLLDVTAPVTDIERVLHVHMMNFEHPVRGRFYAPDREPSLDWPLQVLDISGLDNFELPHPMSLQRLPLDQARSYVTGSGRNGYFIGKDFRAAYAPAVSLTGSGQTVGLLEFDGFYAGDVRKNAAAAGVAEVPTQTVLLDGFSGAPGSSNIEVILDIMMASYMAPGLSKVIVYEGYSPNDILNRMATDNLAPQLSSSWGFSPVNATTEQIYKQFAAQGQSMLQASGDSGAYANGVMAPSDDPALTVVGGTSLTTAGAGGPWQSETTWSGSGGGISNVYPIPAYQLGLNMAANRGSTTMRNIPDVALTADIQMYLIQNNGQAVVVGGTSAAAPLWTGFIALANQQAAANAKPRLGFLNPLLYGIGSKNTFTVDLNDIKTGNNGGFSAVSGYDLTTGWGSPAGQHLIDDLSGVSGELSFKLNTSSTLLTLQRSAAASAVLTVTATNGFNGSVTLGISGLPSGITASFSPAATLSSSKLTVTASASAPAGTYPVTVTGISGSLSSSTTMLVNLVVPGFSLSVAPGTLGLPRGSTATAAVAITAHNGFAGSVAFSATGLPTGVSAAFAGSAVTLAATSNAAAGNYLVTLTGISGALKSSASLTLSVVVPTAGTTMVNLAPAFNINAMVMDGAPFAGGGLDGGLNGSGTAYSANLLGVQQAIRGIGFSFGPANAMDAVSGKTVSLPSGKFTTINLLATGVNGNQPAQTFKVIYTDGTSSTFVQNVSDWFTPQNFSGETKGMILPYRDNSQGQKDNRTFYLYEYSFALTATKTVASMVLPTNRNVVVLAASFNNGTTANAKKR